ncbi:MAG: NAD-dependent epimerase/dehydratase family protein [bacterium]
MRTVVTGGAGFMGSQLARHLVAGGHTCVVLDNLSRAGVRANLEWLLGAAGGRVTFIEGDVRDPDAVRRALDGTEAVFHLAAQTAVTTSVTDPAADFAVNAGGTMNVLEAARRSPARPRVVFASTNKVYGDLDDLDTVERPTRYDLARGLGVSEAHPIAFHTPYGCSKGAADQYVQDYGRIYGLRTAVLRMSCIYGPRQFGTEDQGWVAHFAIAAALGRPLVIYGDGKQVRDVLFIDDLVRLYARFLDPLPDDAWGRAYNAGGGAEFTLSLLELLDLLEEETGARPAVSYAEWRPSDQRVYVSDTTQARQRLGWRPQIPPRVGVHRLAAWVREHRDLLAFARAGAAAAPRPMAPAPYAAVVEGTVAAGGGA